jgi:hypothetical protein
MSKINNDSSIDLMKPNKNPNNNISLKEEDEQETKDESHPQVTNPQEQEIIDKKIID